MNREELIEEAAKLIYAALPAAVIVPWEELRPDGRVQIRDRAESVLAVFEKAHAPTVIERHDLVMPIYDDAPTDDAPTDDEREVKRLVEFHGDGVWRDETGTIWVQQSELVDAIRRSEVPEPSDENYDEDTLRKAFDALVEVTGSEITADDCINQMQNAGILFRERGAEPQGEPSDAQVEAALHAYHQKESRAGFVWLDSAVENMRAALRAAGEVAHK